MFPFWPEFNFALSTTALLLLALLAIKLLKIGQREEFLPPGPPTVPVLGNLHVFPLESPHLKQVFISHAICHFLNFGSRLQMGPGTVVVINSMEAAKELMEKRSATTSGRPKNHMIDKITDGLSLSLVQYSDTWRTLRKAARAILTPKAVHSHLPIQRAEACQTMYDFLKSPENFFNHIGRYSNSVIMSILFGKRCPRYESVESTAFFDAAEAFNHALSPSVPPVDLFPFLDYLPERWAWWKRLAREVKKMQHDLYFGLVDECEKRMQRGEHNGSFMEILLSKQKELDLNREMIGHLGGVLLEGATETTTSALRRIVLFLAAFPDAQRKAQEEIDRVIGHERSPILEDFKDLPYIQALIKEYRSPRTNEPLIIPKGATIFVNTYAIYHDPDYFDEPETFLPERYLNSEYGTKPGADRVCPGIPVAENSLALNTMNFVWAFDFKLAKEDMNVNLVDRFFEKKGLVSMTLPFKCHIQPRNTNVSNIIEREYREAVETFIKFEKDLAPADKQWVDDLRKNFFLPLLPMNAGSFFLPLPPPSSNPMPYALLANVQMPQFALSMFQLRLTDPILD
uniref:Putative cytochrome P450 n=1 Tax=Moniliophthora roreri TaxID=221103 RepID=A0A0W0F4D7_MONRR